MRERDFAYAVSRIRALETKLLDRAKLERISESASLSDAILQLAETEYGPALANLKQPEEFETALNAELARIVKLLLELAKGAPELAVFVHRYDIQNIKTILKLEAGAVGNLSNAGVWSAEWLEQRLKEMDLSELPELFGQAISEAKAAFKATGDTQEIDRIMDFSWFEYGYFTLKTGISEPLLEWWLAFIDLTNFRTFIRLRLIGTGFTDFVKFFIPNGRLALVDYKELWDQPNEKVAAWFGNTPYYRMLSEGIQTLTSLTLLERESDNQLMDLIIPAKMISLGIEPLIGYLVAKETELRLLRIILVGKANQVSNQEIKERLRRAYA